MTFIIKRLLLGICLIVLASAVLLVSDRKHRRTAAAPAPSEGRGMPSVALFQFASRQILDDAVSGITNALGEAGFEEGRTIRYRRYNAQSDLSTATSIAKAILEGDFALVLTVSTPCLQAMASANREGKLVHVFGAVTDPFVSGVGISRTNSPTHPRHLVGIGTFQPVKEVFRLMKRIHPSLKTVGVVWCTSETCSEACTRLAREVCPELGIELIEAPIDTSSGVQEAAQSLVSKGVQALWIGGDNIVEMAAPSVFKAAKEGRIPVFANAPVHAGAGALLGLGADYFQVGRIQGELAARILKGLDPAAVRIENKVPQRLAINLDVLKGLGETWSIPDEVLKTAAIVHGGATNVAAAPALRAGKMPSIHFINYVNASHVEETVAGFHERFAGLGFARGRDYTIKEDCAQTDMATLNLMIDAAVDDRADLILLTSTPTLQAALRKVKDIPIVFGTVANPVLAGAGKSYEEHQPNVTGIATLSDFTQMVGVVRQCLPAARRIGTLFVPAEVNSVFYKETLTEAAKAAGLDVKAVPVTTGTEIADAAVALAGDVDAICQISDNLCDAGFGSITRAARRERKPLFVFVSTLALRDGAAIAVARDFEQVGRDMADLAARILRGEKPAAIPFRVVSKTRIIVNLENARLTGLDIPEPVLKRADKVAGK